MYEVTIVIDGILKNLKISANDSVSLFNIITNQFSGNNIQIINYKKI